MDHNTEMGENVANTENGEFNNTYREENHDDDVFVENELSEDHHVTINDINTTKHGSTDWQRKKSH